MMRAGMMREMGWQVDEEVNQDKSGEADGMNREVDSKDEVMHISMSDLWFCNADNDKSYRTVQLICLWSCWQQSTQHHCHNKCGSNCPLAWAVDGHNALWHHWLMPISCHFRDCKALLVTSLTRVSGAITSVQTFTLSRSLPIRKLLVLK